MNEGFTFHRSPALMGRRLVQRRCRVTQPLRTTNESYLGTYDSGPRVLRRL